jgi:hypothetical protein
MVYARILGKIGFSEKPYYVGHDSGGIGRSIPEPDFFLAEGFFGSLVIHKFRVGKAAQFCTESAEMGAAYGKHAQVFVIIHPVNLVYSGHRRYFGVDFPALSLAKPGPFDKIMNILPPFLGSDTVFHRRNIAQYR